MAYVMACGKHVWTFVVIPIHCRQIIFSVSVLFNITFVVVDPYPYQTVPLEYFQNQKNRKAFFSISNLYSFPPRSQSMHHISMN